MTLKQNSGMDKAKFDKLEKRIQNIKNSQKQTGEFDGAIDNLIGEGSKNGLCKKVHRVIRRWKD